MNNKMKTILQVIARILLLVIIIFVFYCTISMNREIVLDTKYEYVAVEGVVNVEPENKFDVVTQSYSNDKERYFTYLNYNGKRYCIEGEKYYNYCIDTGYNVEGTPYKGSAIYLHCVVNNENSEEK